MNVLELLVILFALFAFSRALLRFKDKAISWRVFTFWTVIWAALIALIALRRRLGFIGELTGTEDPFKIIVIISIVLLFYLLFRLYVKLDNIGQKITKLTRKDAIKKARKK